MIVSAEDTTEDLCAVVEFVKCGCAVHLFNCDGDSLGSDIANCAFINVDCHCAVADDCCVFVDDIVDFACACVRADDVFCCGFHCKSVVFCCGKHVHLLCCNGIVVDRIAFAVCCRKCTESGNLFKSYDFI